MELQSKRGRDFALRYAEFVVRHRLAIIVLVLLATALLATQIPKVNIRNDPDTLLPPTNRYVATNLYGEHKFGMGNLMVWGLKVKEGDIYQPWFINMVQELHNRVATLPHANATNFIDLAAQKVKYMGLSEDGGLEFKRLIPTEGISTSDPVLAKQQLDYLRDGLENNPAMGPMLLYFEDAQGNKCEFHAHDGCLTKATFIMGDYSDAVKDIYLPWIREVRAIVDDLQQRYGDKVEFMTAGEPYFLAYMLLDLVNKWWLFALSVVIVAAVLWAEFKTWRGAVFPLVGVFCTILMTLGLMGWTEYKLTTMMVLTPMLLLATGIGHSVQITRRFVQECQACGDIHQSAVSAVSHTIIPAILSIITDMVGFATLATVDISFYKDYAYFGMFGMMTLLVTTITLIPLLMLSFPPTRPQREKEERVWEYKLGRALTGFLTGPLKWAPIAFVLVLIGASVHYTDLVRGVQEVASGQNQEFDIMPGVEKGINYSRAAFKEESETIRQIEALGKVMPGVISVNIPVRGKEPVKDPCGTAAYKNGARVDHACYDADEDPVQGAFNDADVLADLEAFEEWLRAHPYVGYTGSYVQFVKLVNMLMSSPQGEKAALDLFHIPTVEHMQAHWEVYQDPTDPQYVPDPHRVVQMYNGLLQANSNVGDLESFVDTHSWNEGIVMGFVNTMDPVQTHQLVLDIQKYLADHADSPGFRKVHVGLRNGEVVVLRQGGQEEVIRVGGDPSIQAPAVGGFLGATEATREVAMAEWLRGPLTTALAVFLIGALIFQSWTASGILLSLLLVTLFTQYGLGGYFTSVQNWSGNLAFHTQVALSIAIGLGMNYGIYIISRLREEMEASGGNWDESLCRTLSTTGSAVVVSIIVLLGSFIPLVSTDLANTWVVAVYIGEALVVDMITALLVLPLLVRWFKPAYVFGNRRGEAEVKAGPVCT